MSTNICGATMFSGSACNKAPGHDGHHFRHDPWVAEAGPLDLDAIEAKHRSEFYCGGDATVVLALVAEVRRLRAGGKALGESLHRVLTDVVEATDSQDLLWDDGDGDWAAVWDRLYEQKAELDALRAEVAPTATEWGVRYERPDPEPLDPATRTMAVLSEENARAAVKNGAPIHALNRRVVSREVTAWTEVTL